MMKIEEEEEEVVGEGVEEREEEGEETERTPRQAPTPLLRNLPCLTSFRVRSQTLPLLLPPKMTQKLFPKKRITGARSHQKILKMIISPMATKTLTETIKVVKGTMIRINLMNIMRRTSQMIILIRKNQTTLLLPKKIIIIG